MLSLPVIYAVCAAILLLLDVIWLNAAKRFYSGQLGDLQLDSPRLLPRSAST